MSETENRWRQVWEFTRKYILNKYIIVLVIFGVVMAFVGNQSAVQRIRRARTIDSLRTERDHYGALNRQSITSLERFARERDLMHSEDEDVYIVTDSVDQQ